MMIWRTKAAITVTPNNMGILGIRMARNAGPLDLKEFDQHLTRILGLAAGSTLVSCKGIACHFPGGEGLVM